MILQRLQRPIIHIFIYYHYVFQIIGKWKNQGQDYHPLFVFLTPHHQYEFRVLGNQGFIVLRMQDTCSRYFISIDSVSK